MGFKIICRRCSYVLYSGEHPVSTREIVKKYGERCPRCLRRLSYKPRDVVLKTSTRSIY